MPRIHPKPAKPTPQSTGPGQGFVRRSLGLDYGPAIDAVLTTFRLRIEAAEQEWSTAPSLLSELLQTTPARQELLVRNSRRFHNLHLCGLLLEQSAQDSARTPRQGERLAALALLLVESLNAARYGDWTLADARARCWMLIGEARRRAADLGGAEEALRTAEAHLLQGTGDRVERARLLAYKAGVRRDRRQTRVVI